MMTPWAWLAKLRGNREKIVDGTATRRQMCTNTDHWRKVGSSTTLLHYRCCAFIVLVVILSQDNNEHDKHAFTVMKDGGIVGHIP